MSDKPDIVAELVKLRSENRRLKWCLGIALVAGTFQWLVGLFG